MDIEVREYQAPKIVINYESLKAELQKSLESYKGLIVTEDTLTGCKNAQKELASLRVKIDTYRKDKKKELEKPIKDFETQCKELIALVDSVEQPIKAGIKVFDDQKREEKRLQALALIAEVAEESGLNEKYTAKLDVLDKYMNLTATAKAVREDLETRAFALRVEQDREAERLEIIKSVLDGENGRLKTPLQLSLWQRSIDNGAPTSEIIASIKEHAALVYEAENKPAELPKEQQPTEAPKQEEKQPEAPQTEQQYEVVFKLVGSYAQMRSVSDFLKANGINYTVESQLKV